MTTIDKLLLRAVELKASDLHVSSGARPIARVNGKLAHITNYVMTDSDTMECAAAILEERELTYLMENGEVDTSYAIAGLGRFRVNAFRQKGSCAIVCRTISDNIPGMQTLGLPPVMKALCEKKRGLILVTGPTGSGKSTTLASMVDYMNQTMSRHVVTIEDPIEYLHRHGRCIVNQREIGSDTIAFSNALRAALRQDPDVILVGEMRDLETISTALTAAETGHLVLSTLHTIGAAKTIDRIIDVFSPSQQQQIRTQLSSVLEAVISQQIIPKRDGKGRVAAFEVMLGLPSIRNLIREGKTHQLQTIMQTNQGNNMQTMDTDLVDLYKRGIISSESVMQYAVDPEMVGKQTGV